VNKRRLFAAIGAAALAGSTVLVLNVTSASADTLPSLSQVKSTIEGTIGSQQMDALQRDLGASKDGVYKRLAVDKLTGSIAKRAKADFSGDYAGSWTNSAGTGTVVAVTNPALVDDVRDLGAKAKVVDKTLSQLNADQAKLDKAKAADKIYGWSVDIVHNTLKVKTGDVSAAKAFVKHAGVDADIVKAAKPKLLDDIVGGAEYGIDNQYLCSVGFSATKGGAAGFYSAGHCGQVGSQITSGTGAGGSFQNSVFPGEDYSWIQAGSGWTASPQVNGSDQTVADSNEAAVGSEVCRSGRTTGWQCGTIQETGASVTYPEGTVNGMTGTDACAEPGDSGGSFITGASAQGTTSGGSGDCTSGGYTYFYPINSAISGAGADLTTG
jgi:streptogrisin C